MVTQRKKKNEFQKRQSVELNATRKRTENIP